ncbi:MAG: HNH/endonuclease VII fold putative polymorphic toxin [Sulfurimonas sp.]
MAVEDNRQLHQAEITWINDNAKKFADQEGISLEEAKDRLAQQALRDVDAIWNIALGEDDAVAQTFIAEKIGENDTFENTRGEQQVFFTTENGDFYDPSRYAVQSLQADPQLYQNAQQTAKEKTGELLSNPDKLKDAIEKKFDVNLNDVLEYANDKINANKDKNLEETTYDATLGRFQDTAKDGANYAETTLGIGETDKEIFDGIYGDGAGTIIKDIAPTAGIAAVILVNRKGAFQQAKRDANIPASQQPDMVYNQRTGQYQQYNSVLMKDRQGNIIKDENGNDIWTKEYQYTREDGSKIIIQDHSAGHQFGEEGIGDQGTHFNVRPVENTRTGNVPGTEEHYPFNN